MQNGCNEKLKTWVVTSFLHLPFNVRFCLRYGFTSGIPNTWFLDLRNIKIVKMNIELFMNINKSLVSCVWPDNTEEVCLYYWCLFSPGLKDQAHIVLNLSLSADFR